VAPEERDTTGLRKGCGSLIYGRSHLGVNDERRLHVAVAAAVEVDDGIAPLQYLREHELAQGMER
jgi:hypothetical protein